MISYGQWSINLLILWSVKCHKIEKNNHHTFPDPKQFKNQRYSVYNHVSLGSFNWLIVSALCNLKQGDYHSAVHMAGQTVPAIPLQQISPTIFLIQNCAPMLENSSYCKLWDCIFLIRPTVYSHVSDSVY